MQGTYQQHRKDSEVEALTMLMNGEPEPMTDQELKAQIGAAALDGDSERVDRLEADRDRLHRSAERQQLADAERQRRQIEADAAERDHLLAALTQQRDDYRRRFVELLHRLDVTAPSDAGPVIEEAYTLGRQAYSIAHDLSGALGDRHLALSWDVTGQIELHGSATGAAFVRSIIGRAPTVPTPWAADLDRLRELAPRQSAIGNGG